jgi:VIT1/CCC1 family predicted Fe2+/Mn2+ transporter
MLSEKALHRERLNLPFLNRHLPVLSYVFNFFGIPVFENAFSASAVLTSMSFIIIGYFRSYVTHTNKIKSILETLSLGIIAAVLAYFAGAVLQHICLE